MSKENRKKVVRLNKQNTKFVLEKIAGGMDLTTVCKQYSDKVPTASAIRKAATKDPELHDAITRAYDGFMMVKMDEIERLSLEQVPANIVEEGKLAINAYLQNKRLRIDTLKFTISKVAPMISKRFEYSAGKNKTEEGDTNIGTQIVIQNYSDAESTRPKELEGNVYEHNPEGDQGN
jgi:hypothetical protein